MSDFYKNKKIVVTGGSGMIGTHMIQHLLDKGAWVRTSTHNTPLRCGDKNIDVVENIDLTNHNSIILGAHKNSIENKELLINKGIPESRITLLLDHTSSILNTDELESS